MEILVSDKFAKRARQRRIGLGLAQAVISHIYEIPLDELRARTRGGARAAFARQAVMYLGHVVWGFSLTEVAEAFGRDRSTASHACHVIEDMRDDPVFDRQMSQMELVLREATCIEVQR